MNAVQVCGKKRNQPKEPKETKRRRNGFYICRDRIDGYVILPFLTDAPPPLKDLLQYDGESSINVKKSINVKDL